MPDHSSDAAPGAVPDGSPPEDAKDTASSGSRIALADWRLGGPTVLQWREWLLAIALLSLGTAILAGTIVKWLWQAPWAAASATALLWVGMLVPIVSAMVRSRPAGLFRFRALDLLYGVALGGMLRLVQGWIEQVGTGTALFPSYPLIDGRLPDLWWLTDLVAVVAIAPVIEEFFFRGVVLVALYTVLRGPLGRRASATAAVALSTGLFILVHSLISAQSADQLVATGLVGLVCGLLVVLTGRIWGAVMVHVVYNATFVLLALTGSI